VYSVESQPTFRRNISPPSSGSKNKPSKNPEPELCLPLAFTLVSFSAYFSILKMEAICSSETSVDFQRTSQRYIPEPPLWEWHWSRTALLLRPPLASADRGAPCRLRGDPFSCLCTNRTLRQGTFTNSSVNSGCSATSCGCVICQDYQPSEPLAHLRVTLGPINEFPCRKVPRAHAPTLRRPWRPCELLKWVQHNKDRA
jgi:hypothetical protein